MLSLLAHVWVSQGDQPKRLGVNKSLIQNILVSAVIQWGFYPTRRAWLFQECLLWHFFLACVFMQTCSVSEPVFTPFPWHVLAFAEIHHLQCLSKDTCTDLLYSQMVSNKNSPPDLLKPSRMGRTGRENAFHSSSSELLKGLWSLIKSEPVVKATRGV